MSSDLRVPLSDGTFLLEDAEGDLVTRVNEAGEALERFPADEWFIEVLLARADERDELIAAVKDLHTALKTLVGRVREIGRTKAQLASGELLLIEDLLTEDELATAEAEAVIDMIDPEEWDEDASQA